MHVVIPVVAFLATVALHLTALRVFPRLGLLDFPERYGLTRARLPYPTGVIAVLLFVVIFAFMPIDVPPGQRAIALVQQSGLIMGVLVLGFVAFLDDRLPLPWWVRLLAQAGIALLIFLTGTRIYSLTNPLEGITGIPFIPLDSLVLPSALLRYPSLVGFLFTLLWLGLTTNALNWFDGIPGQVSVLSTIGFLTIGALAAFRTEQPTIALLAFTLAGISLGSLFFDFPPPKVLMGDTGAMFFGLMLGVLTIYSGGKVATAFLVLGVPLIDVLFVIVRRLYRRRSLARGNTDDEHLHHRLLRRGWTPRHVIFLTTGIGTLFGVTALFLTTVGKFVAALVLLAIMFALSLYSRPVTRYTPAPSSSA
jgi:UDP-GlcNAc:undecaprenyl-phosphate GlcNAc-1-phosphate transferase